MRLRDWQSRLDACIRRHSDAPFRWGSNDCVTFAAECVQAVTGKDLMVGHRGTYATALAASGVLRKHGGVESLARTLLGQEIEPQLAQPADIGVCVQNGHLALCVCASAHWLAPGADGLVSIDGSQVQRAWRCAEA